MEFPSTLFYDCLRLKRNKMSDKLYLYPLWIRIWHGFNAIFILTLIVTGISMQYSNPNYPIISFKASVLLHNAAGIGLAISYLFYFIMHRFSPNRKHYRIEWKGWGNRIIIQMKYYLFGIFKGAPTPFPVSTNSKFNPLQKITYLMIMFIAMPVLIITGLALLFPETIVSNVAGIGGTLLTALLHSIIGFAISVFLIIHVYFCTIGSTMTSNFKSIINGWHE